MQTIHDLETPAILIDLDIMDANLNRIQQRCNDLGLQLRPHIKTHKIPDLAKIQLEKGASGIACQKVTEAEVFVDAGITDIQIPYNIVGEKKTARLAELAKRATVSVTVDSIPVAEGIAQAAQAAGVTIRVLTELVSDQNRTGTTPEAALSLARRIQELDGVQFVGVMIYPAYASVRPRLLETITLLEEAGIPVEVISGGGTGAILEADDFPELTEFRIGTYIFNDWRTVSRDWAQLNDCAMTIRATVVSANDPKRVILDAGSKTVTMDTHDGVHGYIVEYPEARFYRTSEEHGFLDFSAYEKMPVVGDIIHIIPIHTCIVTNLHDQIYGIRGENVEQVWSVAARGRVW